MQGQISGGDINAVLRLAATLGERGDAQLSILSYALAIGCVQCGVRFEDALPLIRQAFERAAIAEFEPLERLG